MRGSAGRLLASRLLRTGVITAVIVTLLGPPLGLLWAKTVPTVRYVIVQGEPLLAEPEGQGPIGVDARFALIVVVAGLVCGVAAYLAGGRGNDVALLAGVAVGGAAAAVLVWQTGHLIGLGHFDDVVRTGHDGTTVTGPADVRARGLLVMWPLLSVAVYGLLEMVVHRLPAGDRGEPGAGEPDEVGGDELDLQSAPAGRDADRREP